MNQTNSASRLCLYLVSGLVVAGSGFRIWQAYNVPVEEELAPETGQYVMAPLVQAQDTTIASTPINGEAASASVEVIEEADPPTLGESEPDTPEEPNFNVPQLIGLNVDSVINTLGVPNEVRSLSRKSRQKNLVYERAHQQLIVHYNTRTKRVLDFYLPAPNTDGYKNPDRLTRRASVDYSSPNYTLKWAYKDDSMSIYKGVKVIPNVPGQEIEPAETAPKAARKRSDASFDIPALIGLDIDSIKAELGASRDQTPPSDATRWVAAYRRGNEELFIDYNPQTRQVSHFIFSFRRTKGKDDTQDMLDLMARGNIQEQGNQYQVEWLRDPKSVDRYEGLKITGS